MINYSLHTHTQPASQPASYAPQTRPCSARTPSTAATRAASSAGLKSGQTEDAAAKQQQHSIHKEGAQLSGRVCRRPMNVCAMLRRRIPPKPASSAQEVGSFPLPSTEPNTPAARGTLSHTLSHSLSRSPTHSLSLCHMLSLVCQRARHGTAQAPRKQAHTHSCAVQASRLRPANTPNPCKPSEQ
jgi:hypothetical protein